jgi:hypothetical protein
LSQMCERKRLVERSGSQVVLAAYLTLLTLSSILAAMSEGLFRTRFAVCVTISSLLISELREASPTPIGAIPQ